MAGGGITKMEELSVAIREFKASGKKVIALGESYDQTQYYVAANADEIYLDPQGVMLIEGYGYYRTFLKGAVDKLGVEINIFKAGKFKSATEQFSRSEMSPEDKRTESCVAEFDLDPIPNGSDSGARIGGGHDCFVRERFCRIDHCA